MPDVAAYLSCAVVVLVCGYKLVAARGGPANPLLRYVCGVGLCLGVNMAVLAPGTIAAVGRVEPVANLAPLVGDRFTMAALGFLALAGRAVQSGQPGRRAVRWHLVVGGGLSLASVVLFLAAGTRNVDGQIVVGDNGKPLMAVYHVIFLGYIGACLAIFLRQIGRHVRHVQPSTPRLGLRLIMYSATAGILWAAWTVDDVRAVLFTGREGGPQDGLSTVLGAGCLVLGATGLTVTAWGPRLGRGVRWLRAYRGYRRIGPLWSALHAAVPEIALAPREPRRVPRDAEFALYRRVIEIRDGHLALRAHFHPEAPRWAAEAAGGVGSSALAATVEAATIAAAIEAAGAGRRYRSDPAFGVPHEVQANVAAETAWLAQVADAFTRSKAVAGVRRRVREELVADGA
ncbi:hypothetical protein F0L68_32030 [Solihabitans fulvus]|uniref:DUF6545 domain-containing protein n=1 Tax=Solihabitans fulvus TaxID=1892852 RepID=A0A5B2WQ86_9PSEU|nr:MAB_1171c family putative transporter [Solihabitans fulvus]KAA2253901.1 hypothetical protein F0L68_32030 [Solihabitans fulvus]